MVAGTKLTMICVVVIAVAWSGCTDDPSQESASRDAAAVGHSQTDGVDHDWAAAKVVLLCGDSFYQIDPASDQVRVVGTWSGPYAYDPNRNQLFVSRPGADKESSVINVLDLAADVPRTVAQIRIPIKAIVMEATYGQWPLAVSGARRGEEGSDVIWQTLCLRFAEGREPEWRPMQEIEDALSFVKHMVFSPYTPGVFVATGFLADEDAILPRLANDEAPTESDDLSGMCIAYNQGRYYGWDLVMPSSGWPIGFFSRDGRTVLALMPRFTEPAADDTSWDWVEPGNAEGRDGTYWHISLDTGSIVRCEWIPAEAYVLAASSDLTQVVVRLREGIAVVCQNGRRSETLHLPPDTGYPGATLSDGIAWAVHEEHMWRCNEDGTWRRITVPTDNSNLAPGKAWERGKRE